MKPHKSLSYIVLTLTLGSVLILGIAPSLLALEGEIPPTYQDIALLNRDEVGARWAGMGGACIALVDDGAAAFWNPAGLGKIKRIEIIRNSQVAWSTEGDGSSDMTITWHDTDELPALTPQRELTEERYVYYYLRVRTASGEFAPPPLILIPPAPSQDSSLPTRWRR